MNDFLQKLIDRAGLFLILVGLITLIIGASGGFQSSIVSIPIAETSWRIFISVIGFIVLSLGLFSIGQDYFLTKKGTGISIFPVKAFALVGRSSVYKQANELVCKCKGTESILATSLGRYSDEEGEDVNKEWIEYVEILARKIGEAKKEDQRMEYKVVMAFQPDGKGFPPPDKLRAIKRRGNAFVKHDALDRLSIMSIDISWSIDVLIIGSENMIIGFPTVGKHRDLMLGIRIQNREFVENAIAWFNEFVWKYPKAIEWSEEKIRELIK